MESKVATTGSELQDKHKDITAENNVQYKSVKHANELLESGLNKRADKYEEDRIGQGVTSKVIGTLAQIPTVGNGGNLNVGGLNKAERAMQNLQGDIKPLKSTTIKPLQNKIGEE